MKCKISILLVFFMFMGNIRSCNIDSLFEYHISSIESYLDRIIKGEILPTGNNEIIYASIDRKPVKTIYDLSSKFVIAGDNSSFLKMYEMINEDIEFERQDYIPNIMISYDEISEIRKWLNENYKKLNKNKIIKILELLKLGYNKIEAKNAIEIFYQQLDSLKEMDTFIK